MISQSKSRLASVCPKRQPAHLYAAGTHRHAAISVQKCLSTELPLGPLGIDRLMSDVCGLFGNLSFEGKDGMPSPYPGV